MCLNIYFEFPDDAALFFLLLSMFHMIYFKQMRRGCMVVKKYAANILSMLLLPILLRVQCTGITRCWR